MICNKTSYPCVIIDVLTDVWVEYVIKAAVGVFTINVWTGGVIGTLSGVQADVIIAVVSDIDVEILADVNANVLVVAAMAPLQFAM